MDIFTPGCTSIPGFLNLNTADILGQIILCFGRLPCALEDVSNTPGLYPLDDSSILLPSSCDNQKCLQTLLSPGGLKKLWSSYTMEDNLL